MTNVNGTGPNGSRKWQLLRSILSWSLGAGLFVWDATSYTPGLVDPVVATLCAGLLGLGTLEMFRR